MRTRKDEAPSLSESYPALIRVLYVHNRVLYGTKHCYARLSQTHRAHLNKFVNLCPRYDSFRPCQTLILSIQEIPDRTAVDQFRQPERTAQFFNLFLRYDPLRPRYTPTPSIHGIPARTTLGPFGHREQYIRGQTSFLHSESRFVFFSHFWIPFEQEEGELYMPGIAEKLHV